MNNALAAPLAALETKMAVVRAGFHASQAWEIALINAVLTEGTLEAARRLLPWATQPIEARDARLDAMERMTEAALGRFHSLDTTDTLSRLRDDDTIASLVPRTKREDPDRRERAIVVASVQGDGPLPDEVRAALRAIKARMAPPVVSADFAALDDLDDDPVTTAATAYGMGLIWEGLNALVDAHDAFRIEEGAPESLSISANPQYVRENPFDAPLVENLPHLARMLDEEDNGMGCGL